MRIGELLVHLGRITPAQVEEALAHQQSRGGFLGDALIRLGFITRDELRWTLADQHDIPFVRLHPDHIDHGLAALTPAAWAREHHILPVLRDGDRVTAVIGDVADLEKLDEVRRLTGAAAVEAALSPPETIRDLIDAVYGPAPQPPSRFAQLVSEALSYGAESLGVSVRDGAAVGWYRIVETVYRPLEADWVSELRESVSPLAYALDGGHRAWPALLAAGGAVWRVECQALGQGRSLEWMARLVARVPEGLGSAAIDPDLRESVQRAMARGPSTFRMAVPPRATLPSPCRWTRRWARSCGSWSPSSRRRSRWMRARCSPRTRRRCAARRPFRWCVPGRIFLPASPTTSRSVCALTRAVSDGC